jgi:hypothetical protein
LVEIGAMVWKCTKNRKTNKVRKKEGNKQTRWQAGR